MPALAAPATPEPEPEGQVRPALLDYPRAAEYCGGVEKKLIRRLVDEGSLTPIRIGRRVLFPIGELPPQCKSPD